MKILFLHSLSEPELGGGSEVIVWEQIHGLCEAGHECVLLATTEKPGLICTKREGVTVWLAGIRNIYWPYQKERPAKPWRFIWHTLDKYNRGMQEYLREVVEKESPDVVSLHCLGGWSAASWVTLNNLNIPVVQILHDYYAICPNTWMNKNNSNCLTQCISCRLFRLQHRSLSKQVSAVVGVSRFVLDRHLSNGYFQDTPIQRIIYNARSSKNLGVNDASNISNPFKLRFGFIGQLIPSKGIEQLIDAFLTIELPEAELLIAGTGKLDYVKSLYNKSKDTRLRFLGRVSPCDFYPGVDVVIVPTLLNESFGMVVAEALAFGKPVIASRRGGITEIIRDGENGLLFEPGKSGELVKAMEAMADKDIRTRMTEHAKPSALSFVDVKSWINNYESLYREVIASDFAVLPRKSD